MIVIEECYSLKSHNTFGLQSYARFFAEAANLEGLQTIVNIFKNNHKPKLILGGGSNLLFLGDFDGIVIAPALKGKELVKQTDDHVWIKAYAGENWDSFVAYCVSMNWGGLENLSLIPGNVGACPVQNIGAYGVEVKDVIDSVEAINIQTGDIRVFSSTECKFGYRDSIFKHEAKNQYIISSVHFKLSKKPVLKTNYADVEKELKNATAINVESVRQAIITIRQKKLPDPEQLGNAGSFFKNPLITLDRFNLIKHEFSNMPFYPADNNSVKISAAWLIQACGWKDKREGNVGTYHTQPLVIVNHGGATGNEILEFATKIQNSVRASFGIELEMEVNII